MSKIETLIIPVALAFMLMFRVYIVEDLRQDASIYMLYGMLLLFIVYVMFRGNLWVGLFMLLALLSAHYPVPIGVYADYEKKLSQETFTYILLGGTLYLICVQLLNNEKALRWSLNILCVFAILNVVFLILQYFNIDPLHAPKKVYDPLGRLIGLMTYPHGCSAVLAMSVAFFRGKWMWFLLLIGLGLVMTHTFAGPMALAFGICVAIAVQRPLKYTVYSIIVLCAALLLYAYLVDVPDTSYRLNAWKIAVFELIPQKWLFGYGLGHWQLKFANLDYIFRITGHTRPAEWMKYAHNDLIQASLEMGPVFFLAIFAGYVRNIVKRFRMEAIRSIFSGTVFFACSMVAFPMHVSRSAIIGIFILAWIEVSLRKSTSLEKARFSWTN